MDDSRVTSWIKVRRIKKEETYENKKSERNHMSVILVFIEDIVTWGHASLAFAGDYAASTMYAPSSSFSSSFSL